MAILSEFDDVLAASAVKQKVHDYVFVDNTDQVENHENSHDSNDCIATYLVSFIIHPWESSLKDKQ